MELNYKIVKNHAELLKNEEQIFSLFEQCFDENIDSDVWEWMYGYNSVGHSIVSLCFDGGVLVGHYGAIQLPVVVRNEKKKVILSVGSMVHSSYRKFGVFVKQGEQVYESVKDDFICVIGFPNKKALPSRKKRLAWNIDESDYVALVTRQELISSKEFNENLSEKKDIELDLDNSDFLQWRLSKPLVQYYKGKSVIIKKHKENQDIVFIKNGYEADLEDGVKYHILCDGRLEALRKYKVFDYPFGSRIFNDFYSDTTFKKDLIMSDVF